MIRLQTQANMLECNTKLSSGHLEALAVGQIFRNIPDTKVNHTLILQFLSFYFW